MSPRVSQQAEVQAVLKALPAMDKLLNRPASYHFTRQDVQKLAGLCQGVRTAILR